LIKPIAKRIQHEFILYFMSFILFSMYFRSLLYFLKILKGKQKLKTGEQYQGDTRPAGPTEESSWLTHAIRGAARTRSPGRLTRAVVRSPVANE
jgi:hypothetical protein